MKERIFQKWTFRRWAYLLGGLFFIGLAAQDSVWWIGLIGLYYAGISIFGYGCAGGNCTVPVFEEK